MTIWFRKSAWSVISISWLALPVPEAYSEPPPTPAPEIRARIQQLGEEGQGHLVQRRFDLAAPPFEQALELAKRLDDPVVEARLAFFAGFAVSQLDLSRGLPLLERAAELCREAARGMEFCPQNRTLLTALWAAAGASAGGISSSLEGSKAGVDLSQRGRQLVEIFDHAQSLETEVEVFDFLRSSLQQGIDSGELDGETASILREAVELLRPSNDGQDKEVKLALVERLLEHSSPEDSLWANMPGMWHQLRAQTAVARGRHREAIVLLQEAHRAAEEQQNIHRRTTILQLLSGVYWELGEREPAREVVLEAIRLEEAIELDLVTQDPMMMELGLRHPRYVEQLIQYDAWAERSWDAFARAEGLKARTLSSRLAGRGFDKEPRPTPEQQNQLEGLKLELRRLEEAWETAPGNRREALLESLEDRRQELVSHLIRQRLRAPDPEKETPPSSLLDLETLRARILPDDDTTLISYFATWRQLLIWVIDGDSFHMATVDVGRETLAEKVRALVRPLGGISQRSPGDPRGAERLPAMEDEDLEARLYEWLVAPVRPYLEHSRLTVIPHAALHALPFAALRDPKSGRYLLEDFVLDVAPSMPILDRLTKDAASTPEVSALVLGNPQAHLAPLPGAEREARRVARILKTEPVLGLGARESLLRRRIVSTDLLHIAAHGIHNERAPYFSRLELAADDGHFGADGHLEIYEILTELDFGALDLVVLSGCQTALGELTPGDEIVSLARAFLYAGSPAVVSTLWSIDDEASSKLMEVFYQQLWAGESVAEALRTGQLHLLGQGSTRHPYYWAGYIVEGDSARILQVPH